MSRPKPTRETPRAAQSPVVGKSGEDGACERERVVKEVGLTSTTFIGPTIPSRGAAKKPKADLEDKLSDFYKELEAIETSDVANGSSGRQGRPAGPPPPADLTRGVSRQEVDSAQTDGCWRSRGQRQLPLPHWQRSEPYHPGRPMDLPNADQNWRLHPPPPNGPPDPRSHGPPPFHRPHCPPAFPRPPNPLPHVHPSWSRSGMTHRYPPFDIPPPNAYSPTAQERHGEYPHRIGRDTGACTDGSYSDNGHSERFTTKPEEWRDGFHRDYDGRRDGFRFDPPREQQLPCRPTENTCANNSSLVLILMRGLPGSGKSTLARELLFKGPNGLILSTDDYFARKDGYCFEPHLLGVAHDWNHGRANGAMRDRRSPIIIDNTNIEAWEMKPYVQMAMENGYQVDFREPDTSWKLDPYELEKRNTHGVSQETIAKMLKHFSFRVSIDIVMGSQAPPHVTQRSGQLWTMGRNRDLH